MTRKPENNALPIALSLTVIVGVFGAVAVNMGALNELGEQFGYESKFEDASVRVFSPYKEIIPADQVFKDRVESGIRFGAAVAFFAWVYWRTSRSHSK